MIEKHAFTMPENYIENISEEDYRRTTQVIETIKSLSRMAYQSVYVIDYFRKDFLYVSDNPLFLCGLSPQEVQKQGFAFYCNHVPKEEVEMLLEINKAGFKLFNKTPANKRLNLFISYDFHIQDECSQLLINHKLSPILLAENGNLWLAACVVSLATQKTAGNFEAHMHGEDYFWTYSLESRKWEKAYNNVLNEREKEILLLSAQGNTIDQIADKLYITNNTVKYHRKNLFKKIGVSTISEALWLAAEKKMI